MTDFMLQNFDSFRTQMSEIRKLFSEYPHTSKSIIEGGVVNRIDDKTVELTLTSGEKQIINLYISEQINPMIAAKLMQFAEESDRQEWLDYINKHQPKTSDELKELNTKFTKRKYA